MIDIDFGSSQDGPTLWFIVNDVADFPALRQMIFTLSNGSVSTVDVLSERKHFRASDNVANLIFAVVAEQEKAQLNVAEGDSNYSFAWKQSRLDWDTALQKIDAMDPRDFPAGHQYFDFRNITVEISIGEGLSRIEKYKGQRK